MFFWAETYCSLDPLCKGGGGLRVSRRTRRGTLLSNIIICCTHPQAEIIDFSKYQNCLLRDRRKENIDLSFILYTESCVLLTQTDFELIEDGWGRGAQGGMRAYRACSIYDCVMNCNYCFTPRNH